MNRTFTYLITQKDSPCTVESYLKKRGYSHPILVQLKKTQNGILVNQKWAYVKTILNPDDKLEIHLEETASSEHIVPVELPFSIVYEDEDILVVNKPADMPIHPQLIIMKILWQMQLPTIIKNREKLLFSAVSTA